jgi:serine protease AprX
MLASAPAINAAPRVHPALLQAATQDPTSTVKVIVQKQSADKGVEENVVRLGGRVTKDLYIINAFVAEMPAKAVPELAQSKGVRWISPDAKVRKSTDSTVFTTWATELGTYAPHSISATFNSTPISAGRYIWFNSTVRLNSSVGLNPVTLNFDNATAQMTVNSTVYTATLPSASVTFDPAATTATSTYDADTNSWNTRVPANLYSSYVFMTGAPMQVPANWPGNMPVTMSGYFTTNTPGVSATWKWGAAVYTSFSTDYTALNVKPCDNYSYSVYRNTDAASTPENFKLYTTGGAMGSGGTNYTGTSTSAQSVTPKMQFNNVSNMIDAAAGATNTYASGSSSMQSFGGFSAEMTPGNAVTSVEVVLQVYASAPLNSGENPVLSIVEDGQIVRSMTVDRSSFNNYVGAANAGAIYLDITGCRNWRWADFDNDLQLVIDQSNVSSSHTIYYDVVGLRVTSSPGDDVSGGEAPTSLPQGAVDLTRLSNVYNRVVRATDVWNMAPDFRQGQGVTVAVVDSGIYKTDDLRNRVIANVNFNESQHRSNDKYGHGTFVAGVIAGDGNDSDGSYMGVAPKTNLINVRVSDDQGVASESDVVEGLQWILAKKNHYNIRVVNISLNSSIAQSYHQSPLNAASEILWFNGIVVVASAGNNGSDTLYAPANDPFVITVGATDDRGTVSLMDDTVASFSAYGLTETGAIKPDIVAPGTNIVSLLPQNDNLTISQAHPANRLNTNYFRMSGTSMAAPMVAGAVALLLQDEPNLNPDQVKFRLMSTAAKTVRWVGYNPLRAGAGLLDVYAALTGTSTATANTGTPASQLLWTGNTPVNWSSVNWSSVNWSSVNWSSVNWSSVNWSSVNWSSDYWTP